MAESSLLQQLTSMLERQKEMAIKTKTKKSNSKNSAKKVKTVKGNVSHKNGKSKSSYEMTGEYFAKGDRYGVRMGTTINSSGEVVAVFNPIVKGKDENADEHYLIKDRFQNTVSFRIHSSKTAKFVELVSETLARAKERAREEK